METNPFQRLLEKLCFQVVFYPNACIFIPEPSKDGIAKLFDVRYLGCQGLIPNLKFSFCTDFCNR